MGKINVLDISVANMIAAGEVVERPASVVKELVENSIDAGAKTISVEIKNGGISYIRVTDDGHGIEQSDVPLAFVRHATSKICEAKDLEAISTLGFRGEALCSVAAVAKVVLTSKTADAPNATRIKIEGGEMDDIDEVGAPNGTTIEIKQLFYNTPARMKFLKKDTTEAGYITDIMQRFVLAHPEVSFRYINAGKQILHSSGDGELINAIYTVYGRDYAKNVIPVSYSDGAISVSGYIGKSMISRPNRTYQSFFVNERYIKSRTAAVALEEAYKNQLMGGKFPFAVIKLSINPSLVDVNVHPNKTEVKFSDERKVFDAVYWAVKNALYEKPIIPDVSIKEKREAYKNKAFSEKEKEFVQTLLSINVDKTDKKETIVQQETVIPNKFELFSVDEKNKTEEKVIEKTPEAIKPLVYKEPLIKEDEKQSEPYIEHDTDTNGILKEENINTYKVSKAKDTTEEETVLTDKDDNVDVDSYRIIGTAFNTYIILERGESVLLIDQHAAHERLKYEQLMKEVKNSGVKIQSMLMPVVVDLSAVERAYVCENTKEFLKLGFDIEQFGENTIVINGAPANSDYDDIADLFVEILSQMMADKKQPIASREQRAMYTIACKAAIKANQVLDQREIKALVDDVLSLDSINTCPHGRPITISLTRYEIEKQFKRIV